MFRRIVSAVLVLGLGSVASPDRADAGEQPYLGDITMVGFGFCPRNWLEASGQILTIEEYPLLFALLGVTFGGNGRTTFALPDLRGRVPVAQGQGTGLSDYKMGQTGGAETHTMTPEELPSHQHQVTGSATGRMVAAEEDATTEDPNGQFLAVPAASIYGAPANPVNMANGSATIEVDLTSQATGGNLPIDLRQPYLTVRFCIAVRGQYPPRN